MTDLFEEIFPHDHPSPGRNDPCYCGSGAKYKRCCESVDREAWRVVALKTRQADAVGATLPAWRGEG